MEVDFFKLARPCIRDLTPYQPGKPIEELERELGITSSIKLASNENPLGPSPAAIAAIQKAQQHIHIYPDGSYYELKHAIGDFLKLKPEQITVGNGSENILELIIKSYLQKDDSVIISQYAFLTIPILLKGYGITQKTIPAHHWGHDIDAMIKAVDETTKMIFLINPNNPTGTYTNKEKFEKLLKEVPKNILIIVDEAYIEYIQQTDYPNTLTYLNTHPNLVITRTFSKAYGLAALRIGYAISSTDIANILNRARLPFNVNTLAAKAAVAALTDHQHVADSIQLNQAGKHYLETELKKLSLEYIPSLGNFVTIDVHDGKAIYEELLKLGIIVRPLVAYGMPKHIRVTIGTPQQNSRFIDGLTKTCSF